MTTSKQASTPLGPAPDTESKPQLKRKRCRYSGCKKLFMQTKHWQEFCQNKCRQDYHKYGAAFGDLEKAGTERLIKHAIKKMEPQLPKILKKFLAKMDSRLAALEEGSASITLLDSRAQGLMLLIQAQSANIAKLRSEFDGLIKADTLAALGGVLSDATPAVQSRRPR